MFDYVGFDSNKILSAFQQSEETINKAIHSTMTL